MSTFYLVTLIDGLVSLCCFRVCNVWFFLWLMVSPSTIVSFLGFVFWIFFPVMCFDVVACGFVWCFYYYGFFSGFLHLQGLIGLFMLRCVGVYENGTCLFIQDLFGDNMYYVCIKGFFWVMLVSFVSMEMLGLSYPSVAVMVLQFWLGTLLHPTEGSKLRLFVSVTFRIFRTSIFRNLVFTFHFNPCNLETLIIMEIVFYINLV
ncbi:hypothetical protein Hanom_Chr16g01478721 [Helianthus anomalus]